MSHTTIAADGSSTRDAKPQVTITINDASDRWRYTCPVGHRGWVRTNYHFWCRSCAQANWEHDPEFHELYDRKTSEKIHRSRIRFIEPTE